MDKDTIEKGKDGILVDEFTDDELIEKLKKPERKEKIGCKGWGYFPDPPEIKWFDEETSRPLYLYDTWEEAHNKLLQRAIWELEDNIRQFDTLSDKVRYIRRMKNPETNKEEETK